MEHEVKSLKDAGNSWREVSEKLGISVSTARRYYKKAPEYPKVLEGKIYRKVLNPRLIMVDLDEFGICIAVITPGLNYRRGKQVRVEQLDERNYRVLRD